MAHVVPFLHQLFSVAFALVLAIDLALSVDNAGVNAAIVRSYPKRMRNRVLLIGVLLAIVLRIVLTFFVGYLYLIPGLKLLGGIWIVLMGIKMFGDEDEEDNVVVGVKGFLLAGLMLGWTDLTMSMDNVLALIGAANGSIPLVVIGVIITIPILFLATKGIVALVERWPQINFVFACLLGLIGVRMIAEDSALSKIVNYLHNSPGWIPMVIGFGFVALAGVWINVRETRAKRNAAKKAVTEQAA